MPPDPPAVTREGQAAIAILTERRGSHIYSGQTGQHCSCALSFELSLPRALLGATSATLHIVGKHHTFGQKTLALPPLEPLAPTTAAVNVMFGFTQYGQQWPGYSVS